MALNKTQLNADIKALLNVMITKTDQAQGIDDFASGLADIIDAYIKTASISANPAQITAAGMANTGGPVVAASLLQSTLT